MGFEALFSEWYAVVDPGFTGDRIAKRLGAINKLAASMTLAKAPDLVQLFYSQAGAQEFVDSVRSQLREADDTYVSHDHAELAVVAAGVLHSLFQKSSSVGLAGALLVRCGEFGRLQGATRVDAVVARAGAYLREEGTRVREQALTYPNLGELLKPTAKKLHAATKERAAGEAEADVDSSFEIHNDTLSALRSYSNATTQALTLLEKRRLEESSILYWLLGARALESEDAFNEIDKARLALVAAHDLAAQTQHTPGPASCRAVLKSVIALGKGTTQQASIEACLSEVSSEEGERLLFGTRTNLPVFLPISFGLDKRREVNWETGWESAFVSRTKLKANAGRPIEDISEQFYRELLLSRILKEV
jgi:hypothetical protein